MQATFPPTINGTVIFGATGAGKSYLLQYQALEMLRLYHDAELIYVGAGVRQDPILSIQKESHIDEESDGFLLLKAERLTAYFCDARPGSTGFERVKSAVLDTLAASLAPETQYILALDEVFSFFRSPEEIEELWWMLKKVLDAPTNNITLLATFQTANDILVAFGARGVELFARMNEKFILRSVDVHDLSSVADCQDIIPTDLQRGEAIHIFYNSLALIDFGLDKRGTVKVGVLKLKSVGFARRCELRSERLSEILCLVFVLVAGLSAINFFHAHRYIFLTNAPGYLGTLFYAGSLLAAVLIPRAFPAMRDCVAGWLAAIFAKRVRQTSN